MSKFPLLDKSINEVLIRKIVVECSTAFARYGKTEVFDLDSAYELCQSFIEDHMGSHPMCWIHLYKDDLFYHGGLVCHRSALVSENGIKEFD